MTKDEILQAISDERGVSSGGVIYVSQRSINVEKLAEFLAGNLTQLPKDL